MESLMTWTDITREIGFAFEMYLMAHVMFNPSTLF
jgi:hypothetical protein